MAGEYVELPEDLIQHIQSFLEPEEVARTSILSKLWYSAWSTYPILSLNYFSITDFENYARTSIKRYQKLDLKLNTLKLFMTADEYWTDDDYFSDESLIALVDELIMSALNLCVNDLYVDFIDYTLPYQVFSSISLKKLCMLRGSIELPLSNGKPRVRCSRLVSLELGWIDLSDDMMRDILLGCPLMEDLRVYSCTRLEKINLSVIRCNLRTLHIGRGCRKKIMVEWVENNALGLQNQFHNLISLKLHGVEVDDLFFKLFSHRFPCLETLELKRCLGPVMINIDITSNSLRYLSLIRTDGLKFSKVQALNIQNFRFKGAPQRPEDIPSLSFITASVEWKSDLSFRLPPGRCRDVQVSWWIKIRDILTALNLSEISIDIYLSDDQLGSISEEIIQSNHILPFVENLTLIRGWRISFGWLLCCRPKYITWRNQNRYETYELVYNELKKNENKIASCPLPCIHSLEEVDMEHYDETLEEWRVVRQGDEEVAAHRGNFRLRLKWYYPS